MKLQKNLQRASGAVQWLSWIPCWRKEWASSAQTEPSTVGRVPWRCLFRWWLQEVSWSRIVYGSSLFEGSWARSKELVPEESTEDLAELDFQDIERAFDSDDPCNRLHSHFGPCFRWSSRRNYRGAFQKLKSSAASDGFYTKYWRERSSKSS